jgi:hypothetical protein
MSLLDLVKKEIAEERLNMCKACDEYALGICKKCGCVMIAKTTLRWAACPLGKWSAVTDDQPKAPE